MATTTHQSAEAAKTGQAIASGKRTRKVVCTNVGNAMMKAMAADGRITEPHGRA